MGKIRNKLIELLGGVTIEEHKNWLEWRYINGKVFAYERVASVMKCIREQPVEKQYNLLYEFVSDSISASYKRLQSVRKVKKIKLWENLIIENSVCFL